MVKNFDGKAYQNCVYNAFKKKIKSSLGGAPKNVNASSGIVFPHGLSQHVLRPLNNVLLCAHSLFGPEYKTIVQVQ